jgi:hypothetical protein
VTNRQILAAEQATQLLSRVQEQLSDIQATLVNIDLTTTEQLYLTRRAELNSQAGALQAALQALKERAQAEQVGSPQFFAGLTETGAQVGKGVTTISAETVNLEGYARGVGDIGAGVIRFFDILRVEDFGPQISKIQADLEAVRRAIADLENSIARERERIHGQAMDALASRYNARLQSIRIRQQRAFLGADMLRLAIISHFSNPARHVNDLRINLNGARNHLSGGEEPGFFKWRDIVGQCSEPGGYSVEECFEAGPFNERHLVVYDYPVGNTTIAVPLYSLAATYRKFRLPTYGLRVRLTKDTVQQFEPLLPF